MAYDPIIISVGISTIITLIVFILGNLYNIKLRALDYEIIRKTYLLENCYGVLKAAFDMVHPTVEIDKSAGTTDRVLSSILDNYEKISMTYHKYYFEINNADEELAKMLHWYIYKIERNRVKKIVYLRKLSKLGTATEEVPINEEIVDNINVAKEIRVKEWIKFIHDRIDSISKKYSSNLKKYIEVRKGNWKIVKLPLLKFDQEFEKLQDDRVEIERKKKNGK